MQKSSKFITTANDMPKEKGDTCFLQVRVRPPPGVKCCVYMPCKLSTCTSVKYTIKDTPVHVWSLNCRNMVFDVVIGVYFLHGEKRKCTLNMWCLCCRESNRHCMYSVCRTGVLHSFTPGAFVYISTGKGLCILVMCLMSYVMCLTSWSTFDPIGFYVEDLSLMRNFIFRHFCSSRDGAGG